MKNIIYLFTIIILFGGISCESVLDKNDLSGYSDSQVWSDSILTREYVDYVYDQNLPTYPVYSSSNNLGMTSCSEELYTSSIKYMLGTLGTSDATLFGTALSTSNVWAKIRQINKFLDQIDAGGLSNSWRSLLKGQVYFFRAWRYWEMVNLYGGVPLVLTAQNAVGGASTTDTDLYPKRNSTSECITQICADLDSAVSMLPGKWSLYTDYGRITKGAALAFKGRILLTYASPLFNPNDLSERWQAAYDANKMAKDTLISYGYGLYSDYSNMFFQEVSSSNTLPIEGVLVTCYNTSTSSSLLKTNGWDLSCIPKDWAGSGSNAPTWEIVKAYPMLDGKPIGNSSTYTYADSTYFRNRDPRFAASIAYNGCWWTVGGVDTRLWTWYYKKIIAPATDSVSVESSASSTGFYCRKMVSPSLTIANMSYSGTNWMEIRYAEVLLNLAESACGINRLSTSEEAFTGLIAVRKRAGIKEGDGYYGFDQSVLSASRDSMFKAILWERQIEFAFEGKRYQDLRRWKLFDNTANRFSGYKFNGTYRNRIKEYFNVKNTYNFTAKVFKANANSEQNKLNMNANYSLFFTGLATTTLDASSITWNAAYYFLPIPAAAISNDPNLEQNKDWGGTFDPLK